MGTNTSSAAAAPSYGTLEAKFRDYLAAWNSHDMEEYLKYWADDFHFHLPACPPVQGKEAVRKLLSSGLGVYRETLHPTFLSFGDRKVALEAKGHIEMLQDLPFPFPFDGKTYKKGDKFVYPIISVHYEYDDDLLIKTFRSFGQVLTPGPGEGVKQEVLPGFDPIPETTITAEAQI
ncbi:hypothetical protein SLS57_011257 [Botryosphaeria dothidea]